MRCVGEPPFREERARFGRMADGRAGAGRPAVVVVGSINVDFIVRASRLPAPGETVTNGILARQGGGKSANQALAAARSGIPTVLVAAMGDDDLALEALRSLRDAGVDVSRCLRLPGVSTAVALIAVDPAGENQIVVASGANGSLDGSMVETALAGVAPTPGSVCLLGFEVGDEAVLAGARWAASQGLRIVLNPAPARPIPAELLALAPLLTPNHAEAAVLTGGGTTAADAEAAARELVRRTRAPVIVTLGADGALLLERAEGPLQWLPVFSVATVDTTGAGDAFNGVLAAGLASGMELRAAVRRGMAAAALSTTQVGAQAGLPWRVAIEALLG